MLFFFLALRGELPAPVFLQYPPVQRAGMQGFSEVDALAYLRLVGVAPVVAWVDVRVFERVKPKVMLRENAPVVDARSGQAQLLIEVEVLSALARKHCGRGFSVPCVHFLVHGQQGLRALVS